MRIVVVLGPFLSLPPNPTGAVERLWQDISEGLAGQGHEVWIVGKNLSDKPDRKTRYISVPGETRCGNILWELIKDIRYANRVAKRLPKADIIVTNSFSLPVILGEMKRKGAGFKIVVNLARMPKGQLFLYKKADRISAVSEAVMDEVKRQNRQAYKKSVVINNPIDCTIFNNNGRKEHSGNSRILLYAGRIAKEKGLEILIEAFREVRTQGELDYSLRIVGPYRVEHGGDGVAYYRKLKSLGSDAGIEFMEPIWDRTELAKLYKTSDIFVYPSIAETGETFGISPLEAMACGSVPIVSNLRCFSQFLKNGENGLVANLLRNAEAVADLRNKILTLDAHDIYLPMQKKGIASAKAFSNSAIADKYLNEFEILLKE